jgi:glycogen debranching enzyme
MRVHVERVEFSTPRADEHRQRDRAVSDARMFNEGSVVSGTAGESVTLVEGASFVISSPSGDIESGGAHGLFFDDTRFVSCWKLRLDEIEVENLAVIAHNPFAATFLARGCPRDGLSDSTIVVNRNRFVGNGMREEIVIQNLAREPAAHMLSLELDADFAHIFEVKDGRVRPRGERSVEILGSRMHFSFELQDVARHLEVAFPSHMTLRPGLATMEIIVPARGEWRACFEFALEMDGAPVELRYRCGEPVEDSAPVTRFRSWARAVPSVRSRHEGLNAALETSVRDLGALRIFDPNRPDRAVIAAGAPWFMTLFGRDSLITSLMTLAVDPTLASATLFTLARLQGERVDPLSEEEPGKILHELRHGLALAADARKGAAYYGSIDATPLFVVLLAELYRWGLPEDQVRRLLPNADRALAWIGEYGDRDGDGFVEYERATQLGLANQGWKDSFDGINFASGRLAEPPIALCEVQGYVYAAFRARAELARGLGDEETARSCSSRAEKLKRAFNEQFWLEDRGYFALGLDGEKRPIDSLTSNLGHCLWSGIVDEVKAGQIAGHLCGPEMFSGWGIRTLASSMGAYNPVSYHNGSVWPHDSAIAAAGLMRYGFVEEAQRVTLGLLQAAEAFGGRLPELLCGFDRAEVPMPVRYPTSCSPQAWSSATMSFLLRTTLLRLDVSMPDHTLWIAPCIPPEIGALFLDNVPFAGSRLSIETDGVTTEVKGLSAEMSLVHSAAERE